MAVHTANFGHYFQTSVASILDLEILSGELPFNYKISICTGNLTDRWNKRKCCKHGAQQIGRADDFVSGILFFIVHRGSPLRYASISRRAASARTMATGCPPIP